MIYRTKKNKNYTAMSNYHLQDKTLSLKAKGFMSMVLSLPDDWDFSNKGLVAMVKESKDCVRSVINELKEHGYVTIERVETHDGKFDYEYTFYEKPQEPCMEKPSTELPTTEKPSTEKPSTENTVTAIYNKQNTNKPNTKKQNTEQSNTKPLIYSPYGEFQNVMLTADEVVKLNGLYGEELTKRAIEYLSMYKAEKTYKTKSDYLALRRWVFDAVSKGSYSKQVKVDTRNEAWWSVNDNDNLPF